jgi:hypothetical protein
MGARGHREAMLGSSLVHTQPRYSLLSSERVDFANQNGESMEPQAGLGLVACFCLVVAGVWWLAVCMFRQPDAVCMFRQPDGTCNQGLDEVRGWLGTLLCSPASHGGAGGLHDGL